MTVVVQSLNDILIFYPILLWSDSSIALSRIRSKGATDTWKIFLASRIEEIRQLEKK